jgi:hypothetical protein
MAWTLDVYDRIGASLVRANLDFQALSARWVQNGAGSLEVDFDLYANIGGALPGQNEFQLKRAGVTQWAGVWRQSDVDAKAKNLKITCEGIWGWARRRVVTSDLIYSGLSQHTIAWNLLNHTQGQTFGSLGITNGTANGSPINRDRYYCAAARPNIGDEIEAFTQLDDGFDFEVDPATRAFNTWNPQRKSASGIALDGTKVDTVRYVEDTNDLETFVSAIGADDCGPVIADLNDGTQANLYGRMHAAIEPDLGSEKDLAAAGREELRSHKRPRFDATVTFREGGTGAPAWSSLTLGNTLTLQDDRGYATFGPSTLRMVEKAVHLDNGLPNQAVFELVLSSAVD